MKTIKLTRTHLTFPATYLPTNLLPSGHVKTPSPFGRSSRNHPSNLPPPGSTMEPAPCRLPLRNSPRKLRRDRARDVCGALSDDDTRDGESNMVVGIGACLDVAIANPHSSHRAALARLRAALLQARFSRCRLCTPFWYTQTMLFAKWYTCRPSTNECHLVERSLPVEEETAAAEAPCKGPHMRELESSMYPATLPCRSRWGGPKMS